MSLRKKCAQGQVLVHGQARENAPALRHLAQAGFRKGFGRRPVDRFAVVPDLPLVDGNHAAGGHQGGGFAGTVGPDDGHDLPGIDLQGNSLEGLDGAVARIDVFQFKNRLVGHLSLLLFAPGAHAFGRNQAGGPEEHHHDHGHTENQHAVGFKFPEYLGKNNQCGRPQNDAGDRPHATQDDHAQHHGRFQKGEAFRADKAHAGAEKGAGQTGKKRAHGVSQQL